MAVACAFEVHLETKGGDILGMLWVFDRIKIINPYLSPTISDSQSALDSLK